MAEFPLEPFRIKVVEKVRCPSREQREKILATAGYNLFNIPADAAEGADDSLEKKDDIMYSATQITTAADTKNRVLYYHTQFSRRVRKIDLKKIDFGKIGSKIISQPADKSKEEDILELTPVK